LRKKDEPALVSAVDGAGSAMLFSVVAAIQPARAKIAFYNHLNGIGSQ
jgi:hypothetical protein